MSAIALRFKKDTDELRERPLTLHSIVVHSLELKTLLRRVFKGYPSFARELQKGKFQPPFTEFFHKWDALRDEAKASTGTRLGEEIEALCSALDEEFNGKPDEFNEMAKQNVVTWNLLDYLYEPGTVIVTRSRKIEQAQRIVATDYVNDKTPNFHVETEYIDFDGSEYGLRQSCFKIDQFKGSRKIISLPGIPLAYEAQREDLEHKLRSRGHRIVELNQAKYMQYNGFVWTLSRFGVCRERFIEGRILVDGDRYWKYVSHGISLEPLPNEMAPEADGNFAPESLVLFSPYIRGYDLTSKQWAEFEADNIRSITWSEFAFDRLVLAQDRKVLLKALIDSNPSYKGKMDDIIQGKGQGLVILLSGSPGTGKTLTAEAIAEHLRIPIFAATVSDLDSTYASSLEEELSKVLELSARWGAVLLLDEADAFLETRSDDDLMLNQRVAVFLRLLEYYKGVLILTTNRLLTFDPAFHSRIHLTLHYDALDEAARAAVWKTFLGTSVLSEDDYKRLGKHNLSGRRIKNFVKMAQLLAQSQQCELGMSHLDHVLGVAMHGETSFASEETW
ncbi:hypothetical protein M409DRAFT_67301 [Zasmidium cellare ATCC 36951]|uniref:AAA+ ATPase domain-containing protein n=1 Tax=Zasmidium cellare ATCC 36951 TaxID=1080233 RepID=A0A6A6CJA4_ZASCE|nr:uncharacterized protein M409DRAFT_67301 [Zasmidium cellare ATCC 36951]KAF2165496.1 hypothetical protein M409DRAFT_67301 [Zasmidium cellare ATCC 36951]